MKTRLRLLDAIEKTRIALSGDTEANLEIDYVIDELDLDMEITRDEFEGWIQP